MGFFWSVICYPHETADTSILRAPGLLLIGPDRSAWGNFPQQLQQAGFTVLVMGLRDVQNLRDFTVMIDALNTGVADPGRLAVIGASAGAALALRGCAQDLRCDVLALLSPLADETLLDAVRLFNPRSLFVAASLESGDAFTLAQEIAAAGVSEFQPLDGGGSGAVMLQNRPDVAAALVEWLRQQFNLN